MNDFWFEGYSDGRTVHYRIVFRGGFWAATQVPSDPITKDEVLDDHEALFELKSLPEDVLAMGKR